MTVPVRGFSTSNANVCFSDTLNLLYLPVTRMSVCSTRIDMEILQFFYPYEAKLSNIEVSTWRRSADYPI